MSRLVIQALGKYSKQRDYPLMVIASRNQVSQNGGYVCTSQELVAALQPYKTDNLLICRDHCGPYFADADRGLDLEQSMEQCFKQIKEDIDAGFDLLHIDVSKVKGDPLACAKRLMDYALSLNPTIKFEFGSEDNTGVDVASSIGRIDGQLEFLQQYKDNMVFFVTQTGSLTLDNQAGRFDEDTNKRVAAQIHAAGLLFKEHNADYLKEDELSLRANAGVDSLNIAPQLGKIQTELTKKFASADAWAKFADYVYANNKWSRWVSDAGADRDNAVAVSGHYHFSSDAYSQVLASIADLPAFESAVEQAIFDLVDFYKKFEEESNFKESLQKRLAELRKRDPFIYR